LHLRLLNRYLIRYCRHVGQGEIYPNAPVVLTALEVRHPSAGSMSPAQQRELKQLLRNDLPILRNVQIATVEGTLALGAVPENPVVRVEKFPKYFSRDNTTAFSVRDGAFVIETTRYLGWEAFRKLFFRILNSRFEVGEIDGVERVGLRYIDEIRVPDLVDATWNGWSPWVDNSLLGPAEVGDRVGLVPKEWLGTSVFSPGPDRSVVLRYGAREGYAVDPGGDLKRPTPTPGPFFLLDIDSFWTASDGVPELGIDALVSLSDQLHNPVRHLFESLLRDKLRVEVLRHVD
jgi:uncharacterized protein (TIGR04255 family)